MPNTTPTRKSVLAEVVRGNESVRAAAAILRSTNQFAEREDGTTDYTRRVARPMTAQDWQDVADRLDRGASWHRLAALTAHRMAERLYDADDV